MSMKRRSSCTVVGCAYLHEAKGFCHMHYNRRVSRSKSLAARRAFVDEIKDAPCVDCGGRFPPYVMQFDHLPGFEKVASISNLVKNMASRVRILAEIEKCELVCANCHAMRTRARLLT